MNEFKPTSEKHDPLSESDKTFWQMGVEYFDNTLDSIMWVWDCLMMYVCFFMLAPMLLIIILMPVVDLRFLLKGNGKLLTTIFLSGIPLWMIISAYLLRSNSVLAERVNKFLKKTVLCIGFVLLGFGALMWMLGMI